MLRVSTEQMPANGAVGGAAYNQKKHELLLELLEELKEELVAKLARQVRGPGFDIR